MSATLFNVFLAIGALALTAAGFVIGQFAVGMWILAALVGTATVVVWVWERGHRLSLPPPPRVQTSTNRDATVIASGGDLVFRAGDGGAGGWGGSITIRAGDGRPSMPSIPESGSVQEARHEFDLATAELGSFDRRWAGHLFRSKDHQRGLLVEDVERTRLAHLRAVQAHERQTAPKAPAEITREFLTLRNEGRILRDRINGVVWGERQKDLGFGQVELDGWLGRCATAVWDYRPERQPALERAVQQVILFGNWQVVGLDEASIDLWRERTTRIDLVLAVLDAIIASPQSPSSPTIS